MCNSKNHSRRCTCGFGGDGHRGRRGPSYGSSSTVYLHAPPQPIRSWRLESLGRPLTYPIECWSCFEPVFYHTNGNGDCVLLDGPLGWPWHVHGCWEQHRDQQYMAVSRVDSALLGSDFDGQAYTTSGEYVSVPKSGAKEVSVHGYVSSNDARESIRKETDHSYFHNSPDFPWIRIVVRDAHGILFPFIVPSSIASKVRLYSIVRVSGRWACIHAANHLIAERVIIMDYPGDDRRVLRVVALEKSRVSCNYCGKTVAKDKWGIDSARRVECADCASLRGNVSPNKFLRRIRRIVSRCRTISSTRSAGRTGR